MDVLNNKPNIYAHCRAGCNWETVHKSDFAQAATYVPIVPNEDGSFTLEKGVEYKIFANKVNDTDFDCEIRLKAASASMYDHAISVDNEDKYADSFTFRLLEVSPGSCIYEMSGCRIDEYIALTQDYSDVVVITGATRVLRYNSDASILVRNLSEEVLTALGDMSKALDEIIAIQNNLTGGETIADKLAIIAENAKQAAE